MAHIKDHNEAARHKGEVIHSGHFMISSVADDQEETESVIHERDSPSHHEQSIMIQHGYDFSHAEKEAQSTYQFGPQQTSLVTIDGSLTRLFQCMSLAYQGGKVVSPKWKNFKGLKLTVKDKLRLNNAIWRQWHIQYIIRKKKGQSLIQFATPFEIDFNTHSRPEAVVLEGKYWKRRIETVVAEYKKWRAFFLKKYPHDGENSTSKESNDAEPMNVQDDCFMNDFSDTLFTNLSHQSFQFPNPREIAQHATNSDMIQPGLLQFQPGFMDDYIDFDSFQDLLGSPKKPTISLTANSNPTYVQPSIDVFAENGLNNRIFGQNLTDLSFPVSSRIFSAPPGGQYQLPSKNLEMPSFQRPAISVEPAVTIVNFPTVPQPQLHGSVQPTTNQRRPELTNQKRLLSTNRRQPVSIQPRKIAQNNPKLYTSNVGVPQSQSSGNQATNIISYFPDGSVANKVLENQSNYFTSKKTINVSVNTVIYSQTQTAQAPSTLLQDRTYLVEPQISSRTPLRVNAMPSSNPQAALSTQTGNRLSNETNRVINVTPNLLSNGNNAISSVYSNPTLSRFQVPVEPPIQPGMRNNQRKRGIENDNTINQSSSLQQILQTNRGIMTPSSSHPQALVIPEKRRSVDEGRSTTFYHEQQTSVPFSSGTRLSLSDIDMEQVALEPVSPSLQDSDMSQMDMDQKSESFSSEKKRRFNINVAFTRLQKCLPGTPASSQVNIKMSKASLMHKAAQHIKSLLGERHKMNDEIQSLKQDLEKLQSAINNTQMQLPATGTALAHSHTDANQNKFNAWCRQRTSEDWKFFLFSKVVQPWFESYQHTVAVTGAREFTRTLSVWLQEHCSLRVLRPNIVKSLQTLSTSTSILTDPAGMKEQIEELVKEQNG